MTTSQEEGTPDTARLVERAANGDTWAWERLVDNYAQLISAHQGLQAGESYAADVAQVTTPPVTFLRGP